MKRDNSILAIALRKSPHPTCQKRRTRITTPNIACNMRLRLEEIPPAKKFTNATWNYMNELLRNNILFLNFGQMDE
jgi:hypothetical protein